VTKLTAISTSLASSFDIALAVSRAPSRVVDDFASASAGGCAFSSSPEGASRRARAFDRSSRPARARADTVARARSRAARLSARRRPRASPNGDAALSPWTVVAGIRRIRARAHRPSRAHDPRNAR
jgi:hypothetical protein